MADNKQRRKEALEQLDKEIKRRDRKEKTKPLTVVFAALAVIGVVVGGIWYGATRNSSDEDVTASSEKTTASVSPTNAAPQIKPLALERATALPDSVTCTYQDKGPKNKATTLPPTDNIPATGTVSLNIQTNKGAIGLTLDRSASPCTVNAIAHLAKTGFYNNTVCHRLTTSGILQCGDPTGIGNGCPGFQFKNEYPTDEASNPKQPVIYPRGTVAMANAGVDTNGSQFFLNYKDSTFPAEYTYFGKINDEGLKTLDSIAAAGVKDGEPDGKPAEEVKINTVTLN